MQDLQLAFIPDAEFEARCNKMRGWGAGYPEMVRYEELIRQAAQWEVKTREAQIAAMNRLAAALEGPR